MPADKIDTQFLKGTVAAVLVRACSECAVQRPEDPVQFVAAWLKKFVQNDAVLMNHAIAKTAAEEDAQAAAEVSSVGDLVRDACEAARGGGLEGIPHKLRHGPGGCRASEIQHAIRDLTRKIMPNPCLFFRPVPFKSLGVFSCGGVGISMSYRNGSIQHTPVYLNHLLSHARTTLFSLTALRCECVVPSRRLRRRRPRWLRTTRLAGTRLWSTSAR